jgi:diacylglycerol O-acyltransferase / wax synthase
MTATTTFMRHSDAFTWEMEHDPGLRSTIVTFMLLDKNPDWDVLVSRLERIAQELPMFRQRVVESAPPAPPRWELDPDFDLDWHVRRVTAPAPGSLDTVIDMARRAEMADFDRARPLWQATLVEGLEDGRAALLFKLHHALTDGVGGVQIAMILFDLSEDVVAAEPLHGFDPVERHGVLDGYRRVAEYDAGLVGATAKAALVSAPRAALNFLRRPVTQTRSAAETAASVYRTVRPINRTGSPLMRDRKLVRRLSVHTVPLADLKAAAKGNGARLNDAFLAGITGGLRRYHEKHGVEVGDLHVCMPVDIRSDDDSPGGNRITLMRFDLPVGQVPDAAERIRATHDRAAFVRGEKSLPYTQLIAGALNLMPRWYIASILRHVDFLASDVPGIPVPVYLGGARLLMQYAFGPTIGAAVNVTLMSYVDTCALGINVDTGAIPDPEVFHDCLVAGFDEVLAAGGRPAAAG